MRTGYCFDFDGTVTDRELLPHLAKALDLEEEIEVLTKATMDGHLDFRKSFKLRCRLLASIPLSDVHARVEDVQLQPHLAHFIRSHRDDCAIVTGNLDCWIQPFVERHLGCQMESSRGQVSGDRLLGVESIVNKGDAVSALKRRMGWDRLVCVGDGANDVAMFEQADIAIAFGAVHPPCEHAVDVAHYVVHDERTLCRLISQF